MIIVLGRASVSCIFHTYVVSDPPTPNNLCSSSNPPVVNAIFKRADKGHRFRSELMGEYRIIRALSIVEYPKHHIEPRYVAYHIRIRN